MEVETGDMAAETLEAREVDSRRLAMPAPGIGPRIYALSPAACAELPAWFEHAAALGFDHVLLPVPFVTAADSRESLVADFDALSPAFGGDASLAGVVSLARTHRLGVLIDVVIDRVAASGAMVSGSPFAPPAPGEALDPRRTIETGNAAFAHLPNLAAAEALGAWWGGHLARWHEAGVAGLRLLGLSRVPSWTLPSLLRRMREMARDALLLAWTPGMTWDAVEALRDTGLDFVFPSLPWWDWKSDWLWAEIDRLRSTAKLIACAVRSGTEPERRRAITVAAALGAGWMMPLEAEFADPSAASPRGGELANVIAAANASRTSLPGGGENTPVRLLTAPEAPVLALLRTDAADPRAADHAALLLANTDAARPHRLRPGRVLARISGRFGDFRKVGGGALAPADEITLSPGETLLFTADAAPPALTSEAEPRKAAEAAACAPRIAIEAITPSVENGRFPAKRVAGEAVAVEADIIFDGHDQYNAVLQWRGPGETAWQETPMRPLGNDRWRGDLPLAGMGVHEFSIEAWRDAFKTFRDEVTKKHAAGVDTHLELIEGVDLVTHGAARSAELAVTLQSLGTPDETRRREILLADGTAGMMAKADDRPFRVQSGVFRIEADRIEAQFASWYEAFPRSMSDDPNRHGNFDDVIRHLPRVQAMGFDVLYFPPISPIGTTNRKGRNNALKAEPGDVGSPYAIGSPEGGHDALHPELGTLDGFRRLIAEAYKHGIEIAIDFAVQCSPDHPWLKQHRSWFAWRPDGSMRYAENPPKRYEDIVNVDFYAAGAIPDLWIALRDVVMFWAEQGVRIFRVDNPHTKPFPFWEWMIASVRARFPDALFLAEAFTRPKVMYRLAKIGFTQSYTYFTWRNEKVELAEYLTELSTTAPRDFFRPNFFVNTPDINPVFLQTSGRAGFLIRAALAATLSGLWGVYSGFELTEARPLPGREEYLDSEKYQIVAWDWQRPGNIVREITELNRIRRANPALQTHLGVSFLPAYNDNILVFEKATPERDNVLIIAVSLDPYNPQEADFELPADGANPATDLLNGAGFTWSGKRQHLRLTPDAPYAIWRMTVLTASQA